MLKKCVLCGKGEMSGRNITRRGLAKKKGGTGKKTTRTTKRTFHANLHKIRTVLKRKLQTVYVCTKCIKAGKLQKA